MKIVLTGSKGMLGQAIQEAFCDHELIALDRDQLDITNEAAVQETLKELHPQIVINTAAYNAVDEAETKSDLANQINGYAVSYLARACRRLSATFVHYSTDYVFDGQKKEGYVEADQPAPISVYGKSKLLGEQLIAEHLDSYYIIRVSRLFGWMGTGVNVKKSFVDLMLELSQTKSELEVVDEEISCPTYVVDVAQKTHQLLETKPDFSIYHLANSGGCTWYEFAQEIFKQSGKSIDLKPVPASHWPRPAPRPAYSILLSTKLPALRPWQEALRDYLSTL